VAIGKQLLITRGALTTFSLANDVAKYFAIIPAMFMAMYPPLAQLNIMGLHTPQSAVLSAVIFNALIIIALIPLALLGVVYPLVMTGISQVVFRHQANGSLIASGGKVIGSELIGQNFAKAEYFQPRPSAAGSDGYDAGASSRSNPGPTSQKLNDRVKASAEKFRKENPDYHGPIPADLLTASASGLDPHISPASALAQVARVAKARNAASDQVEQLVTQHTEGPSLGLLGDPRVNVLRLNLALDERYPVREARQQ
jgi:K+-transporting ATPase ATPase C chain